MANKKPKRQANVEGERLRRILAANPVDEDLAADIADLRSTEAQVRTSTAKCSPRPEPRDG
jgi:hypothetical protein